MRTCWLCGKNGAGEPLDHHHIFGGANRRKSEKLGLVVELCHGSCHIFGERAAHRCRETAQALHEYGQRLAMERMGWSTADFVREFGRNYLDEANAQQLRGENSTLISQPLADSFPLKGEAGGEGQSAARTASPQGEAMGAAEAPPEGKARGGAGAAATVSLQGEAVGGGIGFEVTDLELCVNW